jgi:acetyltransferase-like isoleucine patch superfamily enzyme
MVKKMISALCFVMPSWISRILFRLVGHKIGRNVKMPIFSYIHAEKIEIGNDVDIRQLVFIAVHELKIGNNAIISYGVNIKGSKGFYAKDNSMVGPYSLINCEEDVSIGFYSALGPRSTVYTHGSFLPVTEGYPAKFQNVVLEDYVWTGMAIVLLPGAYIESNCIINPGVVLKSRIGSNSIVEIDQSSYKVHRLTRLQKIMKKDESHYHKEMLKNFATYYNLKCEINEKENSYLVEGKYLFKSIPENNTMEFFYSGSKKITYDMANYYADRCKHDIHKKFLFFIRRRYGITLRTKY